MEDIGYWSDAWLFGLPVVAATVVVHVLVLANVRGAALRPPDAWHAPWLGARLHFAAVMGVVTVLVTVLHLLQATLWAALYVLVGALPSPHLAMLYSLNALTAYGRAPVDLAPAWQMLGALEALNGLILFGLSTAFLYGILTRAWPVAQAE